MIPNPTMRVSFLTRALAPILLVAPLLSACGLTTGVHRDTFRPYAPDVVQGNFVSLEQQKMLREGMSRMQVREILGTPLLTSVFHPDRWDYVFLIRRQGVPSQYFRMIVHFEQDALKRIQSDDLPSEAEFAQRLISRSAPVRVPVLEATEEQLRKYPLPSAGALAGQAAPSSEPAATSAPLPASYPPLDAAPR